MSHSKGDQTSKNAQKTENPQIELLQTVRIEFRMATIRFKQNLVTLIVTDLETVDLEG